VARHGANGVTPYPHPIIAKEGWAISAGAIFNSLVITAGLGMVVDSVLAGDALHAAILP